jgi:hypothetical protein
MPLKFMFCDADFNPATAGERRLLDRVRRYLEQHRRNMRAAN